MDPTKEHQGYQTQHSAFTVLEHLVWTFLAKSLQQLRSKKCSGIDHKIHQIAEENIQYRGQ